MRLALVIALSSDRRTGRVLSGLIPADQAVSQVKLAINASACPDARFPVLLAVAVDSRLREHRFSQAEIDQASKSAEIASVQVTFGDLIPVEIGEGEEMIIINVTTQEEADCLKEIAGAALGACNEIKRLQLQMSEALSAHKASNTSAEKELTACREAFVKHGLYVTEATAEIQRLQADKARATDAIDLLKNDIGQHDATIESQRVELESSAAEVMRLDQRVKELEAQLAEAIKSKKK